MRFRRGKVDESLPIDWEYEYWLQMQCATPRELEIIASLQAEWDRMVREAND